MVSYKRTTNVDYLDPDLEESNRQESKFRRRSSGVCITSRETDSVRSLATNLLLQFIWNAFLHDL